MPEKSFWQNLRQDGGLLTWKGRVNRSRFFIINLVINIFYEILDVLFDRVDKLFENTDEFSALVITVAMLVLLVLFIIADFFNISKRFHDIGHPTAYAVVFILIVVALEFFVGMFFLPGSFVYERSSLLTIPVMLYLIFKKGATGPNRYGEDPLADEDE